MALLYNHLLRLSALRFYHLYYPLQSAQSPEAFPVFLSLLKPLHHLHQAALSQAVQAYKPFLLYPEAETEVKTKAGIQEGQGSGRLEFRDMVLTRSTFEVSIGGRVLPKITKQEFAILELLLKNPKQVFSKEDIFEYAWDEPYMGETKTLDVHISNIRKKIKTVTPDEYIETIWGIGYRLHE